MTAVTKIFLASSSELAEDRRELQIFINKKNKMLIEKGIFLSLELWEEHLDNISHTRLQDEYNKTILECDIFVLLFFTKVGMYTAEEFEVALKSFKQNDRPKIYTYFKDAAIKTSEITDQVISMLAFKKKLGQMGHFYTPYKNHADLKNHLYDQIERLIQEQFIRGETTEAVNEPPPLPPDLEEKPPRFGIHHAFTCDRQVQSDIFNHFYNNKPTNQRLHFFYLHGGRAQAHDGLFNRFVARLEGKDLDHVNANANTRKNVSAFQVKFPRSSDPENLKIEVPRVLMSDFQIDEEDMKKVGEKSLAFALDHSPKLKGLGANDQVCVLITISHRHWNPEVTPEVARWFIEEFCLVKKIKEGEESSETIQKEQQRLMAGPEFYFFFAIKYRPENTELKQQIIEVIDQAEYTQNLKELTKVNMDHVEEWFEYYDEFWETTSAADTSCAENFSNMPEEMNMDEVQEKLKKIINQINDKEKDGR